MVQNKSEAERLLAENPDAIHSKNGIGETVLHYLAVEDRLEDVSWLLAHGADINTTNDFGNTPLSEAASLGYYELCDFFLRHNANPRITTPDGESALSEAATNNEYKVVELLLNHINPGESLKSYFSQISYEVLLDKESQSAKLIKVKGLKW